MARVKRRKWSVDEVAEALRAASDPQIATIYQRRNADMLVWGVRFGDMARIVKEIEPDADLAQGVWALEAVEARTVAIRVMPEADLTEALIDSWVVDLDAPHLSDEFAKLIYHTPWSRDRMIRWIDDDRDFVQRTGWALLFGRAADPDDDIPDEAWIGWLDRTAATIHDAPNWSRESMNNLPIAIGLRSPELKAAAIEAAGKYGKVSVFHGDKTNCKVIDPIELLNNPKTKVAAY